MKKLFLLLVLANIVFYLWATNIQPQQGVDKRFAVDPSLEPIVLVSELEVERQTKTEKLTPNNKPSFRKPEVIVAGKPKKEEICYSTSPLDSQQTAETLQAILKKNGITSEIGIDKTVKNAGYWVMYPAVDDMKQARANVQLLKGKGVKDYWLFRKGERKGAISLGLFSEKQRAEKVKAEWVAKGIMLEIKPHKVSREEFALKFRTDRPRQELAELLKRELKDKIALNLKDNRCN